MAYHVFTVEEVKADFLYLGEDFDGVTQTRFGVTRQVNLGDVTGDNRFRVKANTRQEHLHLFDGGVLALIQNDERVVKRTATHVGQRSNFNHVTLDELFNFLEAEHFEQRVIQRAQVGIYFLTQIARQEAQFFTGFNSRAGQQDTADLLTLERINRSGNRQIGFTRTRRAYAEGDVVVENVGDVLRPFGVRGLITPRLVLMLMALP